MNDLKEVWFSLCLKQGLDETRGASLWAEILDAYSGNERYYHGLDHLIFMLSEAEQIQSHLEDFEVFQFSIFYHDIVYDARKKDNEERSADIARDRLRAMGMQEERINACYNQIVATKTHQCEGISDTAYLLDIDLGVLAAEEQMYLNYTENVQKEYAMYPGFLYRKGRKKVLDHFLKMDRIYKTDYYHQKWEDRARINLRAERNRL